MFRKLLLAAVLAFGVSPAWAQNTQCSDRPAGDSTNACANTRFVGSAIVNAPVRKQLTANANYYVNGNSSSTAICGPAGISTCAAGSDSNDCLTPATACLTLQHVYSIVNASTDMASNFIVTVYLAHNAGTQNYRLACALGPAIGSSVNLFVRGDSSAPTATVIQPPSGAAALAIKDLCTIDIHYVAFADNATNDGAGFIQVGTSGNAGHLDIGDVTFGGMTIGTKVSAGYLGTIAFTGVSTDSGNAPIAFAATHGGVIDFSIFTVTVSGTPAYSTAYAYIAFGGSMLFTNTTFSGSATGSRCLVQGPINTNNWNPNSVLPGNTNCSLSQYVGSIAIPSGTTFAYGSSGQCLTSGGSATTFNAWTNCAGAGVPQNNLNTQTTNYTIQTTDCGKTIQAGTGSTGLFTVTLPAVAGFASNCVLAVYNGDTLRGKILSGFPIPTASSPNNILWAGDTIQVGIVNGVWALLSQNARHRIVSATTLFVDNTNGNDANDCLATTSGACKTIQKAFDYLNTWDGNAQSVTISVATGTYTNSVTINGPFHGNPSVTLQGDIVTPSNVLLSTTSATAITVTNGGVLTLGGFKIVTATSGDSIFVSNASFLTVSGAMEFGASARFHFNLSASSTVTVSANYTISGNATRHWNVSGSSVLFAPSTVTLSGTPAFTIFALATTGGSVQCGSTTFSGSASVGTAQYNVSLQGVLNNAGTLPGGTAGAVASGGRVTTPGTPSQTSCGGGSPAVTAGSTDFSGSVTEGTTATGCTITFTTATTFKSCTVSLSTGNAVGITTLGATLVVTHASLSSNVLYWTCTN